MALSRAAIKTAVEEATGRTDKSALIVSAIDLALEEIANSHTWRDIKFADNTILTVASTQTIDLSSLGIFQLFSVRLIQGTEQSYILDYVSEEKFDRLFPDVTDTNESRPTYCYIKGDTLYLAPIPDSAYTLNLRYSKQPVDGAENTIRNIDGAVTSFVISYVFAAIEKEQLAVLWEKKFEKALIRAKRADNRRRNIVRVFDERRKDLDTGPTPWLRPFVD